MNTARNPLDVRTPYCIDCGSGDIKVYWGGGGRCQKCSDKFGADWETRRQLQFKREQEIEDALPPCEECGEAQVLVYGEASCQECCNHDYDPDEGMMCMNCNREYPY
jgi:hypothetical protein